MVSPVRMVPAAELRRLTALRDLQLLDAPVNERFERVVDAAQHEFGVPIACIMLVEDDRQWMAAQRGPLPQETSTDGSICRTAMWSPETFVVPDTTLEPRFAASQYVVGDPHLRFYAAQPLYAPTGEPIGTLCVMDTRARRLEDRQVRSLAELGRWAQNEIFAAVDQEPTPETRERLRADTPLHQYAVLSLPAPAGERTGDRFYEWTPVPHGLLLGVGGVESADGRPASATALVRSALRGAQLDLEAGVALEVAAREILRELAAATATSEVFLARLDTVDGHLDHLSLGRSLAVVVRADGSYERLDHAVVDHAVLDRADRPARPEPRTLVDKARALLSGGRDAESEALADPVRSSGVAAGRTRLHGQDTLICCTQEWSDIDDQTLRLIARAASNATLRELRTLLHDLQRDRNWAGGCGLLLRHEDTPA